MGDPEAWETRRVGRPAMRGGRWRRGRGEVGERYGRGGEVEVEEVGRCEGVRERWWWRTRRGGGGYEDDGGDEGVGDDTNVVKEEEVVV